MHLSLQLNSSKLTRHSTWAGGPSDGWPPLAASSRFLFARPACFATVHMHISNQRSDAASLTQLVDVFVPHPTGMARVCPPT